MEQKHLPNQIPPRVLVNTHAPVHSGMQGMIWQNDSAKSKEPDS